MIRIHVCLSVKAPAARVWGVIAAFDSLAHWHPGVQASPADGNGVGAIRSVSLPDGTHMRERLLDWNARLRRYRYTMVDGPLPVGDYQAEMAVIDTGARQCRLEWRAWFLPVDEQQGDMLAAGLADVFTAGLAGVEAAITRR